MMSCVFSLAFGKLRSLVPHLSDRMTDMSNNYIEFRPFSNGWLFAEARLTCTTIRIALCSFIKCACYPRFINEMVLQSFTMKTDILETQKTRVLGLNIEFGSRASVDGVPSVITVSEHVSIINGREPKLVFSLYKTDKKERISYASRTLFITVGKHVK